ncbi:hypothetical protein [Granulicella sibirica]|uniref:Uncharacterized protein n=1 Tax=Granulicella sibirica TaxID=2479048 RepID=A0A4Q0T2W5_9BACT|nr:hypothetical protein [Granulicella sibirica]RXH57577.1 hypothetical protein GRAN_0887 [Granulicella sibirica]
MFENFNQKDKKLTSLDLGNPPPRKTPPAPAPDPKADAKPVAVQVCVAQTHTPEGAFVHFLGAHRKFEEMVRIGLKPEVLFYVVFPQQGLTHSITTADGLKTIVLIFTLKAMADAYISAKKLAAVAAACRVEDLSTQADLWMAAGINSYAFNMCSRCFSLTVFPISELQNEDIFLSTWRLDLANRRQFSETYGRNAAAVIGTNAKQARIWLEGMRDHLEPANPYLHWVIAVLAGMAGDMEANAASIKRLNAFGPPFTGKLQGTSFDPTVPGSQLSTMAEAMIGLGASLGYLDPNKMGQAAKLQKEPPGK